MKPAIKGYHVRFVAPEGVVAEVAPVFDVKNWTDVEPPAEIAALDGKLMSECEDEPGIIGVVAHEQMRKYRGPGANQPLDRSKAVLEILTVELSERE
jgi:hypothetical protein